MDVKTSILRDLKSKANDKNKAFTAKLIPGVDGDAILGLYSADMKAIAKKYADNEHIDGFLSDLPHKYYEENTVHGLIVCLTKDYDALIKRLDEFLPFVDNWATCDSMRPKAFLKYRQRAGSDVLRWIRSDKPYTVRFGAKMAMTYFTGEIFDRELMQAVRDIKSDHYYVKMMVAWYFATLVAKNRDEAVAVLESGALDDFSHNKAIQKSCESFRVTDEDKRYLKTLKKV